MEAKEDNKRKHQNQEQGHQDLNRNLKRVKVGWDLQKNGGSINRKPHIVIREGNVAPRIGVEPHEKGTGKKVNIKNRISLKRNGTVAPTLKRSEVVKRKKKRGRKLVSVTS